VTGRFETTEWSIVLAAADRRSPRGEEALAALCGQYWYPVYAYVRRQGYPVEEARDLTQGFFTRLLEKEYLRQVDRERGRFRSFLLASCRHFLSNERDRRRAAKRGGGQRVLSIDAQQAEDRFRIEPSHDLTPEKEFFQCWALALLEQVLASLRREMAAKDKVELFDRLKGFLVGEDSTEGYAQAARELATSQGAVRVAVHRLRRLYRQRLREEIARTVQDPEDVEEEMRFLFEILS
jgi:DNA-directed RNA polymerase specialized sigma24 family protein